MFQKLLNPDAPLMIVMSQITDCIFLSMFWFLGCVPLVTVGASSAALYDAAYRGLRKGDERPWRRFLFSYKQNLKPGIISSIVFLIAAAVLFRGAVLLWNNAVYGNISWMLFAAGAFVVFVLVGILSLLFPMLSRFENSSGKLWGNTFRLGFANLPRCLGLSFISTLTVFLCIRFIFPLLFLPGLAALLSSFCIEPVLRPYMPE